MNLTQTDCCQLGICQPASPTYGKSPASHCETGLHCTAQWAECAASHAVKDHLHKCCECEKPL